MTSVRHSATTHVGLVRTVNEDSVLALPDRRLWIVADGMGGHAAGDFASQTVVEAAATLPAGLSPVDQLGALRVALAGAHEAIREEAARLGVPVIGAAIVALMLAEGHFVGLWAGDCRLYRLRDGAIELLTTDHSVVGALVQAGQMSWDEAELHPQSNAITRAAGVGEVLDLDKVQGETRPGDRYILCSDGLTKYAGFETLRETACGAPLEVVADRLLQVALRGGGADNISIIVVDVA
ncbi:PP2C family protein-serine/threonine phosphatase [Rhodosalinus sp.]|uniref:PP2C family protein-serine/threonine phosphatase n=1 Tax=Rhodosalinus sp. TaxID=2047741 RepID=UPI0035675315